MSSRISIGASRISIRGEITGSRLLDEASSQSSTNDVVPKSRVGDETSTRSSMGVEIFPSRFIDEASSQSSIDDDKSIPVEDEAASGASTDDGMICSPVGGEYCQISHLQEQADYQTSVYVVQVSEQKPSTAFVCPSHDVLLLAWYCI